MDAARKNCLGLLVVLAGLVATQASHAQSGNMQPLVIEVTEAAEETSSVPALDQEQALRISQAVLGSQPRDYTLRERQGEPVSLSHFRGKPLLVNFIYTGCFRVCPTSSRALRRAVNAMRDRFGVDQFNVISIGFDQPMDTPLALREFAAKQSIDDPNWAFLSPRAEDVPGLASDFGFSFVATPMGIEHTLQVSILDADGRIHRQVYGDAFAADSLGEPLRQLLGGTLMVENSSFADLLDKVRILCSVYDPATGKYRADYSLYLEIAGGVTFLLVLFGFVLQELRGRRMRLRLPNA